MDPLPVTCTYCGRSQIYECTSIGAAKKCGFFDEKRYNSTQELWRQLDEARRLKPLLLKKYREAIEETLEELEDYRPKSSSLILKLRHLLNEHSDNPYIFDR